MTRTTTICLIGFTWALSLGSKECEPDAPAMCVAGGVTYADGDRGIPAPDGCNTCSCRAGSLACTEIACPPPAGACVVDGAVYQDGTDGIPFPGDTCELMCSCEGGELYCPEAGCRPVPGACEVDGAVYADGQDFPAADGCNTCTCVDGRVGCTRVYCTEQCSVFGVAYADRHVPAPNDLGYCNTCSCLDGVAAACTEAACGAPMPIEPCRDGVESDPIAVGDARVAGDTLSLELSHAGGCAPHYYRVCYEPAFLESNPVQVQLRLEHDGQGDTCEALLRATLDTDLSMVRDAYRSGYGAGSGTVLLRLEGYVGTVTYSF